MYTIKDRTYKIITYINNDLIMSGNIFSHPVNIKHRFHALLIVTILPLYVGFVRNVGMSKEAVCLTMSLEIIYTWTNRSKLKIKIKNIPPKINKWYSKIVNILKGYSNVFENVDNYTHWRKYWSSAKVLRFWWFCFVLFFMGEGFGAVKESWKVHS